MCTISQIFIFSKSSLFCSICRRGKQSLSVPGRKHHIYLCAELEIMKMLGIAKSQDQLLEEIQISQMSTSQKVEKPKKSRGSFFAGKEVVFFSLCVNLLPQKIFLDMHVKKEFASTQRVSGQLDHLKMWLELAVLLVAIPSAFDRIVPVLALGTGCSWL